MDLHAAFSFSFHGYSICGGFLVPDFKAKDGVLDFVPAGSGFEVAPRPVHLHNEAGMWDHAIREVWHRTFVIRHVISRFELEEGGGRACSRP